MLIKDLVEFLKHEDTRWSSRDYENIKIPFQISSESYLEFSEEDFKEKNVHSLVNALSNAKRALDCRIDSLLISLGIYEKAKKDRWGVPRKLEEIQKYGIIAPRVLKKINSVRNLVEHEFIKPDEEQIGDFIDIVCLFLASTDRYIYDFPTNSQIENGTLSNYWLDIEFDYDRKIIKIRIILQESENEEIELDMKDSECSDFLKEYLRVTISYNK